MGAQVRLSLAGVCTCDRAGLASAPTLRQHALYDSCHGVMVGTLTQHVSCSGEAICTGLARERDRLLLIASVEGQQLRETALWRSSGSTYCDHGIIHAFSPDSQLILCVPAEWDGRNTPAALVCAATGALLSLEQHSFLPSTCTSYATGLAWSSTGLIALHARGNCGAGGRIILCRASGSPPSLQLQCMLPPCQLTSCLCFSPSGSWLAFMDHGSYSARVTGPVTNIVRLVHAASGQAVRAVTLPDTYDFDARSFVRSKSVHKQLPSVDLVWSENSSQLAICGTNWHNAGGGFPVRQEPGWPVQVLSFDREGQGWFRVLANQLPGSAHFVRLTGPHALGSVLYICAVLFWTPLGPWRLLLLLLLPLRRISGLRNNSMLFALMPSLFVLSWLRDWVREHLHG